MSKKSKKPRKDLKLNWWQVGVFKLATISFGILLGVYFTSFFSQYIAFFWLTCIIPGLFIAYIYLKK